jgi:uncharacterized protein (TIGR02391 family)
MMKNQRTRSARKGPGGLTPIADLSGGAQAVECAFCEGTAIRPPRWDEDDIAVDPCPVCDGTGVTIIGSETSAWQMCRLCEASGRSWDVNGFFHGELCGVCSGRGIIDLDALARSKGHSSSPWDLLHPSIVELAKPRMDAGHYADAAEAALKYFNQAVKNRAAGRVAQNADGASLMMKVFSVNRPILALDDLSTQSGRDVQLGYMQMFAGAMTGVRNPKAHANLLITPDRALHLLFLVSLFTYKLEETHLAVVSI